MYPIRPHRHEGAHIELTPIPQSIDGDGLAMSEWAMSREDYDRLMCGGHLRLWIYTNDFSRPIVVEVMEPDQCVTRES